MQKVMGFLLMFFLCISLCDAKEQLAIVDTGKIAMDAFVEGTISAHEKVEQNQYDSTRISATMDISGYIYLEEAESTPLNYTEILRLDSEGIVYCLITLSHLPFRDKDSRVRITRTIVNNSDADYEFPDWSGLKAEWFLFKKIKNK